MTTFHEPPSEWLLRHAELIPPGGRVLDLACGRGRNARWLAEQGWTVLGADRDPEALAGLGQVPGLTTQCLDLENGPWPYNEPIFDAVVVCRYLHRPRLPLLAQALRPGGVLIYETFMLGQEKLGRPSNPDFLLRPDELREVFAPLLDIVAFEQGLLSSPHLAMLQRLCATKPVAG
jgi:SAM-dependent methyltransferase